jgi:hypothetical protein
MCLDNSARSTSDSSQTSTTNNTDLRIAGGDGSVNVSSQNSSVALTLTDAGAVHDAFGFAQAALNGAFAAVASNDAGAQAQVTAAMKAVADAWAGAKAGEQKVLVGIGVIVVALVGVAALKKA